MSIVEPRFREGHTIRYRNVEGTFLHAETPFEVVVSLRAAWHGKRKIRLFLGDPETGLDWNEESDVIGYLGRSMGPIKVPLLLKSRRSDGGPALFDHCIVKLTDAAGNLFWQHPNYHCRAFSIEPGDLPRYVATVKRDGEIITRFKKPGQAEKWVAFMRGERANWN
jgi:hypothetical protein